MDKQAIMLPFRPRIGGTSATLPLRSGPPNFPVLGPLARRVASAATYPVRAPIKYLGREAVGAVRDTGAAAGELYSATSGLVGRIRREGLGPTAKQVQLGLQYPFREPGKVWDGVLRGAKHVAGRAPDQPFRPITDTAKFALNAVLRDRIPYVSAAARRLGIGAGLWTLGSGMRELPALYRQMTDTSMVDRTIDSLSRQTGVPTDVLRQSYGRVSNNLGGFVLDGFKPDWMRSTAPNAFDAAVQNMVRSGVQQTAQHNLYQITRPRPGLQQLLSWRNVLPYLMAQGPRAVGDTFGQATPPDYRAIAEQHLAPVAPTWGGVLGGNDVRTDRIANSQAVRGLLDGAEPVIDYASTPEGARRIATVQAQRLREGGPSAAAPATLIPLLAILAQMAKRQK